MSKVKLIRVGSHLMVQFEDGNTLPETDLIIKDPAEMNDNLVEVTVSFMADISNLINDKEFKSQLKKELELLDEIKRLNKKLEKHNKY